MFAGALYVLHVAGCFLFWFGSSDYRCMRVLRARHVFYLVAVCCVVLSLK